MDRVTALLPMKGHSERVPNKNIREFGGSPLYHRVTKSLLASKYIKEVVINTDSEVISRDARVYFDRVRIIDRPESIRGDFVEMNTIIGYDLAHCDGDHFLQTHSTNPLLTTETIDRAIEAYFENLGQYDSLFSVTRWQTRFYDRDGKPVNHNPKELLRTQDLPPLYEENSNIYIFSKDSFKKAGNKRIGLKPRMFEMDRLEAVDIDEEADFKIAEMLFTFNRINPE
jgi:CMP-N-acetylneuraminic acid synthetase